jgi:hypothetical protein
LQLGRVPDIFQVIVDPDKGLLDQVISEPFVSDGMENKFSDALIILIVNLREVHFSTLV